MADPDQKAATVAYLGEKNQYRYNNNTRQWALDSNLGSFDSDEDEDKDEDEAGSLLGNSRDFEVGNSSSSSSSSCSNSNSNSRRKKSGTSSSSSSSFSSTSALDSTAFSSFTDDLEVRVRG